MPHRERNPWYDPPPPRRLCRRHKVEFTVSVLLLVGLLGLLWFGVARNGPP